MELAREPGIGLMANTLVRTVVHVHKEFAPVSVECRGINGITVVLRSNIATVGTHLANGLVMGTVTVFQLIDSSTCCLRLWER